MPGQVRFKYSREPCPFFLRLESLCICSVLLLFLQHDVYVPSPSTSLCVCNVEFIFGCGVCLLERLPCRFTGTSSKCWGICYIKYQVTSLLGWLAAMTYTQHSITMHPSISLRAHYLLSSSHGRELCAPIVLACSSIIELLDPALSEHTYGQGFSTIWHPIIGFERPSVNTIQPASK